MSNIEYSQGICSDGAAILKDGKQMTIEEIISELKQAVSEGDAYAWRTEDYRNDKSATTYSKEVADLWVAKGWPVWPLYTHPVSRQALEGEGEPFTWVFTDVNGQAKEIAGDPVHRSPQDLRIYTALYTHPPSRQALEAAHLDADRIAEIVRDHLTDIYCCTRVWDAWQVGTMTEDDFTPADQTELADEIAAAVAEIYTHPASTDE